MLKEDEVEDQQAPKQSSNNQPDVSESTSKDVPEPSYKFEANESPKRNHLLIRNSRVGNETLSLQEFKENLGSFEDVIKETHG